MPLRITIYSKKHCTHCVRVKALLKNLGISYIEKSIEHAENFTILKSLIVTVRTVPQIFIDGKHIGGADDLENYVNTNSQVQSIIKNNYINSVAKEVRALQKNIAKKSLADTMKHINDVYGKDSTFSTSFGLEDQVITHAISTIQKNTKKNALSIFTLDTGRLFEQTVDVWNETIKSLSVEITSYTPKASTLKKFIVKTGENSFYNSIENRKECCQIRKITPLKSALSGKKIWITGLRQEQSVTRTDLPVVSYDSTFGLIKVNPIIDWTESDVLNYIKQHSVPYNALHDEGFPSIGCKPCTRAITVGEDIRAGRWWWEHPETKECGLHK